MVKTLGGKIRCNFKHRLHPPGRDNYLVKENYLHTKPLKVKKYNIGICAIYILGKYVIQIFNDKSRIVRMGKKIDSVILVLHL